MFNYGKLNNQGSTSGIQYEPHTQVWHATHEYTEEGAERRLPYMYRSFISFSWGGKFIEDFNLIVITTNNAMEREAYAPFDNLTTDLEVVDGQLFWGSHHNANTLDLTLHTDSMTERQLLEFVNWFKPGIERELILSEHPNRGIMARLESPPHYSMLPFEKQIDTPMVEGTSTTEYKGSMTLKFVMDKPFWYSINNFMEERAKAVSGAYARPDRWLIPDMDEFPFGERLFTVGNEEYSKDAWKVIVEDGIPCGRMINTTGENTHLYGGWIHFGTNYKISGVGPAMTHPAESGYLLGDYPQYYVGASINGDYSIAGDNVGDKISGLNEASGANLRFYYAGNAPAKPILEFNKELRFDDAQLYIVEPANKYCPDISYIDKPQPYPKTMNTITLTSKTGQEQKFSFATPSILTAYNAAVYMFENDVGTKIKNMVDLRQAIIENIHHPLIRDALFIELGDETDLRNIVPRAITFAIRRRFAYKIADSTEANMFGLLYNSMDGLQTVNGLRRAIQQLIPTNLIARNDENQLVGVNNSIFKNAIDSNSLSGSVTAIKNLIKTRYLEVSGGELKTDKYGNYKQIALSSGVSGYKSKNTGSGNEITGALLPSFHFMFNSETGEAMVDYKFSIGTNSVDDACYGYVRVPSGESGDYAYKISGTDYSEGAGDMVRSDYLTLTEAGYFNEFGCITADECYTMTHDMDYALNNVKLKYRHMYY